MHANDRISSYKVGKNQKALNASISMLKSLMIAAEEKNRKQIDYQPTPHLWLQKNLIHHLLFLV